MHRVSVDDASQAEKAEVERAARQQFAGRRIARGNLAATPFAEVLAQLYRWRSTGALLLRRDKVKKIIHLQDGYPVLVKSNLLSECLGRVMVRERMITDAQCEHSIQRMKETSRQQGTLLLEEGCITAAQLSRALQVQAETKLYEVFGWLGGDYQFNAQAELPSSPTHLDKTPATLIMEGIKLSWSSERIKQHLHGQMDQYAVPHPEPLQGLQELRLTERERQFAALMDGTRTLRELTAQSPLTPLQTWWLLYGVVAAQVVVLSRQPAPARPSGLRAPVLSTAPAVELVVERAPPSTPVGGSERDQVTALSHAVREMERQDHFELLGVSQQAPADEVTAAYSVRARAFHPDRFHQVNSAELKALADRAYALLAQAYAVLNDANARVQYQRDLAAGRRQEGTVDVTGLLQAEACFQRGEALAGKKQWALAAKAYQEACQLFPDEGEFWCHAGWALFQANPTDSPAQARQWLEHGLSLAPRLARGYLYLGMWHQARGDVTQAAQEFERALQCNPDGAEAAEALAGLGHGAARRRMAGA